MNYRAILTATLQASGLYVAGFVIPILGQMVMLFAPVPFIIAYIRGNRQEGLAAIGLSSVLMLVLLGWQSAALLFLSFGLMAIGIAEAMLRRARPENAVLIGGFLPIAALGTALAGYFVRLNKGPVEVIEKYLHDSINEAVKLYTSLGLHELATSVSSASDAFVHTLVQLLPGILISTFLMQAACCYGLASVLIARKQGTQPPMTLAQWHAPDVWVWGLIASLTAVVADIMFPNEMIRIAGWNLAIIFGVIYTCQGIAIVDHYFRKAGLPTIARTLLHALIIALPIVVCVTALGVVDIWADFRKLRGPAKTA